MAESPAVDPMRTIERAIHNLRLAVEKLTERVDRIEARVEDIEEDQS